MPVNAPGSRKVLLVSNKKPVSRPRMTFGGSLTWWRAPVASDSGDR
jgi:hypothetical protein